MTACLAEPAIDHRPAPRTSLVDEPDEVAEPEVEPRFQRALRGYLDAVARKLGVGLESCTLDKDLPTSAYLAVDRRLPEFPDRDLAMLWDEVHGWAVAIETHSGEDLIVVSYLDTDTVTPPPRLVARYLREMAAGRPRLGRADPSALRVAGDHGKLLRDLESATPTPAGGALAELGA